MPNSDHTIVAEACGAYVPTSDQVTTNLSILDFLFLQGQVRWENPSLWK